jgi:methionine-S-sulfoxide reductase
VGYAGGSLPDPTYRRLGDHAEAIEIDYDPSKTSYERLLDVFWSSHTPTGPPHSTQYRSAILVADEAQAALAAASKERMERVTGRVFSTEIAPLDTFYRAEDYHQKYYLRAQRGLSREFGRLLRSERAFVDSTAVTRANGFAGGCGDAERLEAEIQGFGLSAEGQAALRRLVTGRAL